MTGDDSAASDEPRRPTAADRRRGRRHRRPPPPGLPPRCGPISGLFCCCPGVVVRCSSPVVMLVTTSAFARNFALVRGLRERAVGDAEAQPHRLQLLVHVQPGACRASRHRKRPNSESIVVAPDAIVATRGRRRALAVRLPPLRLPRLAARSPPGRAAARACRGCRRRRTALTVRRRTRRGRLRACAPRSARALRASSAPSALPSACGVSLGRHVRIEPAAAAAPPTVRRAPPLRRHRRRLPPAPIRRLRRSAASPLRPRPAQRWRCGRCGRRCRGALRGRRLRRSRAGGAPAGCARRLAAARLHRRRAALRRGRGRRAAPRSSSGGTAWFSTANISVVGRNRVAAVGIAQHVVLARDLDGDVRRHPRLELQLRVRHRDDGRVGDDVLHRSPAAGAPAPPSR